MFAYGYLLESFMGDMSWKCVEKKKKNNVKFC